MQSTSHAIHCLQEGCPAWNRMQGVEGSKESTCAFQVTADASGCQPVCAVLLASWEAAEGLVSAACCPAACLNLRSSW